MSKAKKTHIRKTKAPKKAKSKYDDKVRIDASFEELLKMAAEGGTLNNAEKKTND